VRQQPQHVQQQLSQLTQQLHVVQQRAAAKEASSKKYKEAVRTFKVRRKPCCQQKACRIHVLCCLQNLPHPQCCCELLCAHGTHCRHAFFAAAGEVVPAVTSL
jgi:hypothetical protein